MPAFANPLTPVNTILSATSTPNVTTANTSVALPVGTSVITATATIDLNLARLEPIFIDGEKVDRVEVTAVYGNDSTTTYITSSGKRIIK